MKNNNVVLFLGILCILFLYISFSFKEKKKKEQIGYIVNTILHSELKQALPITINDTIFLSIYRRNDSKITNEDIYELNEKVMNILKKDTTNKIIIINDNNK